VGRAGHRIGKKGNQSSDPQSPTEQANCKYDDQSSDPSQCSPYQAVTIKIYLLKQQQATVLAACNLLMVD